MLLKPAYHIQTAENGRAALDALEWFRPDVVIMDIKMPEIDGLELLQRVKTADRTIEVIMITAYASLETVKHALTNGAFEYLIKPFARQDLEAVVRRALLRRHAELGARGEVVRLVEEMRQLSAKTRELEEAARREAVEQSLRVTQLSILREISRTIVGELDPRELATGVSAQLQAALGYDRVTVTSKTPARAEGEDPRVVMCTIRDAQGPLGALVADNRASGRAIDPRERELLEMLSEYLAIALRDSRLYGGIADTKRWLETLIASAPYAIVSISADDHIDGWNPAAERIFRLGSAEALGRPITDLLPAADYTDAKQRLITGQAMHEFEASLPSEQGRPTALAIALAALHGRQGEPKGVIAIVQDAVAITRPRWEEKIAHDRRPLHLRLDVGTVESIHGRPAALTEAMTNLILNALDAMPDGGTLRIATRQERGGPVTITVGDSGVGMSEAVRQRVFEPFFSTKGEAGSGLGLSMAYSIVRRHGGDIHVDSQPGRGATFTLTFPAARERAKPGRPARPETAWRRARVLVVDDEPKVLATLAELLQSTGHTVIPAPSGAAALAAYAPGHFDAVLTNLGMAGMNGWEFAERLRAVDPNVAILFITGWGLREEDQDRLDTLKVRGCLFKPVRPGDLDAAIQDALV